MGLVTRKHCGFLLMFSTGFTSLSVLLLFPLWITYFLCTLFNSISSSIDEVLLISSFANVFVFGDFNVHDKNWLTYSGRTDRPGELCYNFSILNDLLRCLTFLLRSLTMTQSCSFGLIPFFLC